MLVDTEFLSKEIQVNGWVKIKNAVSEATIEEIRNWILEAICRSSNDKKLEPEYEDGNRLAVRKIRRLFWNDPGFWERTLRNSGLFNLANDLIGEKAGLIYHAAFNKVGNIGSEVYFHQDQELWDYQYEGALSAWLAVTQCTVENGCIRICSKSHINGLFEHISSPFSDGHDFIPLDRNKLNFVDVEMMPGDLLIWDRFTVHGSGKNTTDSDRLGVVMVFADTNRPNFISRDLYISNTQE